MPRTSPRTISADGSFQSVSAGITENGLVGNPGTSQSDAYSLQLNTNTFSGSSGCTAGSGANCLGWEQFIYRNDDTRHQAFIQYWLIGFNQACQTGWSTFPNYPTTGDTSCYRNSPSAALPSDQPVSNLASMTQEQPSQGRKAVVLLSGGLDSMVCAALAREQGFEVLALTIDYNQRHRVEIEAARRIASSLAHKHIVLPLDLRAFGGSALTSNAAVPKDGIQPGIPITYVPARNLILLSLALGWAEVEGARDLFIGVNALDYSGYPDCRPEFVAGFEELARLATKAGAEGREFTIHDQPREPQPTRAYDLKQGAIGRNIGILDAPKTQR